MQPPATYDSDGVFSPSIDVFVTYRCGLRCAHCFVGPRLDLGTDMSAQVFETLTVTAHRWGTQLITFLGGEPTAHPEFTRLVATAQSEGYQTRIVTNGHVTYGRFLRTFKGPALPLVCFSIDGPDAATHDAIRGPGSFQTLMDNIRDSQRDGYRLAGIVALNRANAPRAVNTLRLCDSLGFEYVNVHYVTNRGFATRDSVLSLDEWRVTCDALTALSKELSAELRVERTFSPINHEAPRCAVRDRTNLMFLPDGRVFMCMLFIDLPNAHSFNWDGNRLIPNTSEMSEVALARVVDRNGCPAMAFINSDIAAQARNSHMSVDCVYHKTRL